MIQSIDKVRAQIQMETFLKGESLRQGQVNNGKSWSSERVSPLVAPLEWSNRGRGKRCSVKPLSGIFGSINVAYNIGEPIAPVVDVAAGGGTTDAAAGNCLVLISVHYHRERISVLGDECSRDAPSAHQYIHDLAAAHAVLFASANGHFVRSIPLERDRNVEIRIAVVRFWVGPDLPILSSSTAAPPTRVLVIQHVRPDEVRAEE